MQSRTKNKKNEKMLATENLNELIRHHKRNSLQHQSKNLIGKPRKIPNPERRDFMLTVLWKVLSDIYFEKIGINDLQILEKIFSHFLKQNSYNKSTLIFKDKKSIESVLGVISDNYIQIFGDYNKKLSQLNFANLLKSYYLSLTYYLPLLENAKKVLKSEKFQQKFQKFYSEKFSIQHPINKSKRYISQYLESERILLDSHISESNGTFGASGKNDINIEIKQLEKKADLMNKKTKFKVQSLCDKLLRMPLELDSEVLQTNYGFSKRLGEIYSSQGDFANLKRIYLRNQIFEIEESQIAESIKQIGDIYINQAQVWLEDSIMKEPFFLEYEYIKHLNKKREKSLFNIYKVGYKSQFYYVSHNKAGGNLIEEKNFDFKTDYEKINLVEEKELLNSAQSQRLLTPKMMCHHCKMLHPFYNVMACNSKISCKNKTPSKKIKFTEKDNVLRKLILGLKDSLTGRCSKMYCKRCLKIWYGDDIDKFKDIKNYNCHFCSGNCSCSRCNRKENLLKVAKIYEDLGGDVETLVEHSPVTKLIDRIFKISKPELKKVEGEKSKKKKRKKKKKEGGGFLSNEEVEYIHLNCLLDGLVNGYQIISKVKRREEIKALKSHISNQLFWKKIENLRTDEDSKILGKKRQRKKSNGLKIKKLKKLKKVCYNGNLSIYSDDIYSNKTN